MAVFFPSDFREFDGRYKATLPGDFVPIAYVQQDGRWLCAACMTAVDDPAQVERYELLYDGPPVVCDGCDALLFALDDPDAEE